MAKTRAEIGDVFRVLVSNEHSGFGQILAKYESEMLLIVLFSVFHNTDSLPLLSSIIDSEPLYIVNSLDAKLWNGEWQILGNIPPNYSRFPLPKYKVHVEGVSHVESYDGLHRRRASDLEWQSLAFRKCFSPQVLQDALKDKLGTLEGKFNLLVMERLRREFQTMKAQLALDSAKIII